MEPVISGSRPLSPVVPYSPTSWSAITNYGVNESDGICGSVRSIIVDSMESANSSCGVCFSRSDSSQSSADIRLDVDFALFLRFVCYCSVSRQGRQLFFVDKYIICSLSDCTSPLHAPTSDVLLSLSIRGCHLVMSWATRLRLDFYLLSMTPAPTQNVVNTNRKE